MSPRLMRLFLQISLIALAMGLISCSSDNMRVSSIWKSKVTLPAGAPFGAIAYSRKTQNWQIVSDLPSKQVAQTKALAGCKAVDCKILITFKKGECATLSLDASKTTRQAYVSFADNEVSAKNSARQACVAGGGRNCKVAPVVCN